MHSSLIDYWKSIIKWSKVSPSFSFTQSQLTSNYLHSKHCPKRGGLQKNSKKIGAAEFYDDQIHSMTIRTPLYWMKKIQSYLSHLAYRPTPFSQSTPISTGRSRISQSPGVGIGLEIQLTPNHHTKAQKEKVAASCLFRCQVFIDSIPAERKTTSDQTQTHRDLVQPSISQSAASHNRSIPSASGRHPCFPSTIGKLYRSGPRTLRAPHNPAMASTDRESNPGLSGPHSRYRFARLAQHLPPCHASRGNWRGN